MKLTKRSILVLVLAVVFVFSTLALVACDPDAGAEKVQLTWTMTNATVAVEGYEELPAEVVKGTKLVFTVTPSENYQIDSVVAGGKKVSGSNGKYTYTASKSVEIVVNTSEQIASVAVTTAPTQLNYLVGEALNAEGMVVTVTYAATGRTETVDNCSIIYNAGEAFGLGDTSFKVKFDGVESEAVQLAAPVAAQVTIKPAAGQFPAEFLEAMEARTDIANYAQADDGVITFTFLALESDIALPQLTPQAGYERWTFNGWDYGTAIPASLNTSLVVEAVWDAVLVTFKSIDLVEMGGKCYLTIEVQLDGVENAYLFLYEGNSLYELKGTEISGTTGSTETLMFDLNKLATAEGGRFAGGWMDIRVNTTIGGKDYTTDFAIDHSAPLAQPGKMVCDEDYCYRFITYVSGTKESLKVYFNQNKVTYTMNVEDVDGQPVLKMDGNVNLNHLTLEEGETFTGGTISMTVGSQVVTGEVDATGAFHATLALSALEDGFNSTFSTVEVKMGDKVVYSAGTLDLIGCSTIFDYDPEGGSPRLYANKFMSANGYQYIYGVDWNEPYLRAIDVGHEIKFTDVTLKLDNDTPYMVLSGTYGSAHTIETLTAAANEMFVGDSGLSLQQYPSWPYRWYGQQDGTNNYTIKAENGVFEIWCDLSKGEGWAHGDIIYGHLGGSDMRTPLTPATIHWGGFEWTIGAPNGDCASWMGGMAIIYIKEAGAPSISISGAHLEEREGKACYIVSGSFENMTEEQVKALYIDLEVGGVDRAAGHITVNYNAEGTFEIVVDVTDFDADGSLLYPHIYNGDSKADVKGGTEGETITVGGKIYTISINWDMPCLVVTAA